MGNRQNSHLKEVLRKGTDMHRPPAPQARRGQIVGLDGLRAVAIIGVVLYHMFPYIATGGFLGVSLFFVLSGYLMAVISRTAWRHGKFHLISFYQKRILRIYPPLILMLCATAFFLLLLAPFSLRGIRSEILSILSGGNNWWQIAQNASYFTKITSTSPLTHIWSLAIEMQYYLIWSFLFLLCMVVKHKKGILGAVLLLAVLTLCSTLEMVLLY